MGTIKPKRRGAFLVTVDVHFFFAAPTFAGPDKSKAVIWSFSFCEYRNFYF